MCSSDLIVLSESEVCFTHTEIEYVAPFTIESVTFNSAPFHVLVRPVTERQFPLLPPETTATFAAPRPVNPSVPSSKPVDKYVFSTNSPAGVAVGVAVGVTVGVAVGFTVGVAVGFTVGVAVGFTVGVAVGFTVGVAVGFTVGVAVGFTVGVAVGFTVGVAVGFTVGVAVGFTVGVAVGVTTPFVATGVRTSVAFLTLTLHL